MKKIFLLISLSFFPLNALFFGNPADPSFYKKGVFFSCREDIPFGCRFGYYGDFVFNRYLENSLGKSVEKASLMTNSGYLVFGMKFAEIFATVGESRVTLLAPANIFSLGAPLAFDAATVDLSFEDNISWSIGARVEFYHYKCLRLGALGHYFQTSPQGDYINVFSNFLALPSLSTTWKEWQVGVGAALDFASPFACFAWSLYSAVKYSRASFCSTIPLLIGDRLSFLGSDLFLPNFSARKHVGLAIGATAVMNTKVGITVEGSFFDFQAVSAVLEIKF